MELNQIISGMRMAVRASMAIVQAAQRDYASQNLGLAEKSDGTTQSTVDKLSEQVAIACLSSLGIAVQGEEGGIVRGMINVPNSHLAVRIDPLDGTAPYVNAASTSTVILALYDTIEKVVVGCIVGEPATGRLWETFPGQPTKTKVWQGELGPKTTVYLDLYPGFTRKACVALTNGELSMLVATLYGAGRVSTAFGSTMVHMMGSNGLHHALVANGGERVAGAITTAIGGPWDVAPVKLVMDAGGAARAFSRPAAQEWIERDPFAIDSYDFLVTGNSRATVDQLSSILKIPAFC